MKFGIGKCLALVAMASLSLAVDAQALTITNGVQKYASLASTTVNMSGRCELWVTNSSTPLTGCTINLNSVDAWLFLTGVKPSVTVSTYLSQVFVNGAAAVADSNCRVVQYGQNGAVVIPQASSFQPLTVFTGAEFTGTATSRSQWTYYTGTGITNISSFKLKRGYQAVLAQSANGANNSKCYVAQDGDLEIGVLPATLDKQVQFIYVTPWRWLAKKGSCDIAPGELNATWWYNWNIDQTSSRDIQYVAIKQQPYWPGLNQDWASRDVNHLSGYNEPNNPVEDAYQNLNPQGSVSDAVARWPELLGTGLRVGAPAVTDGGYSWIVDFVNQADAAGYRVDYVPIHYYRSYWDNNDAQGAANNLYNFLKEIHDATHRPIWLTEFNNGANWTSDADPTFDQNKNVIEAMVNMMDGTPWIERYAIYSAVEEVRQVYYNAGGFTPMGAMYRDHLSPLSYVQAMPDNGTRGIAEFLFATNTWDTSGYYNNGMAVGAPNYTTGHNSQAKAIVLDGTNSYVQLPANIAEGNAFTFAAWVYWNGGNNWQRIFDFGNDTSHYLFLTPSGGNLRFAINNGSGEQIVQSSALASGSWQHVAVTLNGSNAVLYVNGAAVATNSSMTIAPSAFSPIKNYLGKSQFPNDPLFNGKLDEVEIADYAMTAAQISARYNSAQYPAYTGGIWINIAGGNWGTSNNWNGGLIASGVSYLADFSTIDITGNRAVTLDSARTIGGLKFGDTTGSQTWTLVGANTLTLDAGGGNVPVIAVNQNTATISTPISGSYGFSKTGGGTLTLSGTNAVGGGLTVNAGAVNISGGVTAFGSGTSTVGYLTGSGNLTMTAGTLAMAGELQVGGSDRSGSQYVATGTVTVANATLSVGALTVARANYLDNSISGTVTLNSGKLVSTNDVILQFAGMGRGKLALNGGNFIIGPTATKWLMVGYFDSGAGELDVTNGNLFLENGTSIKMCISGNTGGNVVNQVGGNVTFYSDAGVTIGGGGNLDLNYAGGATSTNTYNLNGGTLTVPQIISSSSSAARIFNFNGGTLKPAASTTAFFNSGVAGAVNVRNNGAIIDATNFSITIGQALVHSTIASDSATDGGLRKNGGGTLTLGNTNTYTGNTTVNAGTLALGSAGSIANSRIISVAGGAVLDMSAVTGGFTLGAAQTLSGSGSVKGTVTNYGTIAPGAGIGVLTASNNVTLQSGGTAVMEISKTPQTNDQLRVAGTLTLGGTLVVTNLAGTLAGGERFKLFQAGTISGSFGSNSLPALNVGLAWNTANLSNGILSVVQTTPTNLTWSVTGTNLNFSWPQGYTGWRLLMQTNNLANGISSNPSDWGTVANSQQTNQVVLPVIPASPAEFYRLVYP